MKLSFEGGINGHYQFSSCCSLLVSHSIPVRSTGDMMGLFSGMLDAVPPRTCEETKSQADGTSKEENTSLRGDIIMLRITDD